MNIDERAYQDKVAELEEECIGWAKTLEVSSNKYVELEAQYAALKLELKQVDRLRELQFEAHQKKITELLVAIEAITRDIDEGDGTVGIKGARALNSAKHSELLEDRDRVRDIKLLQALAKMFNYTGLASQFTNLAVKRESSEWKPEL